MEKFILLREGNKGKWKTELNFAVSWTWKRVPLSPSQRSSASQHAQDDMLEAGSFSLLHAVVSAVSVGRACTEYNSTSWTVQDSVQSPRFYLHHFCIFRQKSYKLHEHTVLCIKLENLSFNSILITRLRFLEKTTNSVLLNKYPFLSELCRIKRLKWFPQGK